MKNRFMRNNRPWSLCEILILVLMLLGSSACSKDKCESNMDCDEGEVCRSGKCVAADNDTETDTDTDTTTERGTDSDGADTIDPESDVSSDSTDSDDGGAEDNDSDSETQTECEAIFIDGESCDDACECIGGHCDKGICCTGEECCNAASDCQNDLCTIASCDGNHTCSYSTGSLLCGEEDNSGQRTCNDGAVCDGEARCVPVVNEDCGYFAVEKFECDDTEAMEICYSSCTEEDESETCLAGSICIDGVCVSTTGGLENGAVCSDSAECASRHCENGYCCPTGECCAESTDCSRSLCIARACSQNNRCLYSYESHRCGMEDDEDGDQCSDTERCDGLGNCIAFQACAVYAGDLSAVPRFTCSSDSVSESCYDSCESSAHCAAGFVCNDSDACVPTDLLADGQPCTNSILCESEHCSNGYCCESDVCCYDDEDCAGFVCLDTNQCITACGNDDELCAIGNHCDDDMCIADIFDGAGVCDEDSDCESGQCSSTSGICCAAGNEDCCALDEHCDDSDPCTEDICSPNSTCVNVPKLEGDSCDDGLFCNGEERCDADGECLLAASPCPAGNDPCLENQCDETEDECVQVADNAGEYCSDSLYCLNGRRKVCTDTGACVDPNPEGGVPCTIFSDEKPCVYHLCDEATRGCIEYAYANGTDCDDEDPCTGDNQCQNGECVRGETLPCDDSDPCTIDECTVVGDEAVCGNHVSIADNQPCSEEYICYGESPVCILGECIPSETLCDDGHGICTLGTCYEDYYMMVECSDAAANEPLVAPCNQTTTVSDTSIFRTRLYTDYGEECPGDYTGWEAAISTTTNSSEISIAISYISPSDQNLYLMVLGDWCDELTCIQSGTDGVTFNADQGENIVVLETSGTLPPTAFSITVTCR